MDSKELELRARDLAEVHWAWVETWLHLIYVDAFIHGAKHGYDLNQVPDEGKR